VQQRINSMERGGDLTIAETLGGGDLISGEGGTISLGLFETYIWKCWHICIICKVLHFSLQKINAMIRIHNDVSSFRNVSTYLLILEEFVHKYYKLPVHIQNILKHFTHVVASEQSYLVSHSLNTLCYIDKRFS
jgi:hypothetical protein